MSISKGTDKLYYGTGHRMKNATTAKREYKVLVNWQKATEVKQKWEHSVYNKKAVIHTHTHTYTYTYFIIICSGKVY